MLVPSSKNLVILHGSCGRWETEKKKRKGNGNFLTESTLCQRKFCRYIHIPLTKG